MRLILSYFLFSFSFQNYLSAQTELPELQDSILNFLVRYDPANSSDLDFKTISAYDMLYGLGAAQVYSNSQNEADLLLADLIYQNVANILEQQLKNEIIDQDTEVFSAINTRLQALQYYVSVTPSDWEKIKHYFSEGKISYIFRKFFIRGYHKHPLTWLALSVILVLFVIFRKQLRLKKG